METGTPRIELGWAEHVDWPDLGLHKFPAKIDTGAKSTSLDARDVSYEPTRYGTVVSWTTQSPDGPKRLTAPLEGFRWVTDSGGHKSYRPWIVTTLRIGVHVVDVEVTLAPRVGMRFMSLIGRTSLRNWAIVNPEKRYLLG